MREIISTKLLHIHNIVVALVMLLFIGACNSCAAATVQVPTPTQLPAILLIMVTPTTRPSANRVLSEPTPTAYSAHGDTLSVNSKMSFQARLLLGMDQKLNIVPPEEWGDDGWAITFDEQFLQLDPQIDAKRPPSTGWIWTPKQTGRTRISFWSIVPCRNYNPPCSMPSVGGNFEVTIVEHIR